MAGATYTVQLKPAAERDLKKIKDQAVLRRIVKAIDGLQTNPRPSGVRTLQGDDAILRIRVGDYRIIYTFDRTQNTIHLLALGHRREIYRQ